MTASISPVCVPEFLVPSSLYPFGSHILKPISVPTSWISRSPFCRPKYHGSRWCGLQKAVLGKPAVHMTVGSAKLEIAGCPLCSTGHPSIRSDIQRECCAAIRSNRLGVYRYLLTVQLQLQYGVAAQLTRLQVY